MDTIHIVIVSLVLVYCAQCDAVCRQLLDKGVSKSSANEIVDIHNALRLKVARGEIIEQPPAKNMKKMSWDENLAKVAQKIAETCRFAHVSVEDPRFAVGQNLYWSGSTATNKTPDWKAAISAWFNEHYNYQFGTTKYNHYTQVVWADTYLVGCGYTYYKDNTRPGWYDKLYVCNYGPAGNYIGETPYKVGNGCKNLC